MELFNSGQNFNISNITMEFLMRNKDNNLNNCYSYSLDEHLQRGEQSYSVPMSNFFFHNISKAKTQGEVPFMIPGNIRKKFENFTKYINSKEHILLKDTMDQWNEMDSDYSEFLTTPKGYSDVSNSIASYLIGGFVGSKSQMNNEKHKLSYDLAGAIFKILHDCKCDKPYDKLREEKHKFGKKTKPLTKVNNECFQDVVFCNNLINKNSNLVTCMDATMHDSLIVENIPRVIVTGVQNDTERCFPQPYIINEKSDKPIKTAQNHSENEEIKPVNHNDVDNKCLNTFFIGTCDNNEDQISSCPDNEDESPAKHDNDTGLINTNNELSENEKSDANIFISLSPVNGWSLGVRTRQVSECSVESTDSDSFIVFDDKCYEGRPSSIFQESENDESDFCFEDDDSDGIQDEDAEECCWIETSDECDNGAEEKEIAEANARWFRAYRNVAKDIEDRRRVRFKDEVTIHRMVAWDYAYRAARPGPWEQMAHDRGRFKERIQRLSPIISPVLSEHHRKSVYNKLYPEIN